MKLKVLELEIQKDEEQVRDWAHHSVVSLVDIEVGAVISAKCVSVKRPGTGIPAAKLDEVIGSKSTKFIPKNSILNWNDIKVS